MIRSFFVENRMCAICNKAFEREEIIHRADNGSKVYCHDCYEKGLINGADNKVSELYFLCNNVAHLILDGADEFNQLEDGLHVIRGDDRQEGILSYERRKCDNSDIRDFALEELTFFFVIEKKGGFSCLFFAMEYLHNEWPFVSSKNEGWYDQEYTMIFMEKFSKWTGTRKTDIKLLVDDNMDVVGLMTGGTPEQSIIVTEGFTIGITAKTLWEVIDECRGCYEWEKIAEAYSRGDFDT